jgi:hypothetical protein
MDMFNIYTFGQYLSAISEDNIHETVHFRERVKVRFGDDFIREIYRMVFHQIPVGIVSQGEGKFKVQYSLNDEYDLIVIFGTICSNSVKVSLVTCFKETRSRRVRTNE